LLHFPLCHICNAKNEYYSSSNARGIIPEHEEDATDLLGALQFEMDEAFPQQIKSPVPDVEIQKEQEKPRVINQDEDKPLNVKEQV
jgi:hypothetical protein